MVATRSSKVTTAVLEIDNLLCPVQPIQYIATLDSRISQLDIPERFVGITTCLTSLVHIIVRQLVL